MVVVASVDPKANADGVVVVVVLPDVVANVNREVDGAVALAVVAVLGAAAKEKRDEALKK